MSNIIFCLIKRYEKYCTFIAAVFVILLGCYTFLWLNKRAADPKMLRESSVAREIIFSLLPSFREADARIDHQLPKNACNSWNSYFSPNNVRVFISPSRIKYLQKEDKENLSVFFLSENVSERCVSVHGFDQSNRENLYW